MHSEHRITDWFLFRLALITKQAVNGSMSVVAASALQSNCLPIPALGRAGLKNNVEQCLDKHKDDETDKIESFVLFNTGMPRCFVTECFVKHRDDETDKIVFRGWARMAVPIEDYTIIEVRKPNVGENKPADVTADIVVDTSRKPSPGFASSHTAGTNS